MSNHFKAGVIYFLFRSKNVFVTECVEIKPLQFFFGSLELLYIIIWKILVLCHKLVINLSDIDSHGSFILYIAHISRHGKNHFGYEAQRPRPMNEESFPLHESWNMQRGILDDVKLYFLSSFSLHTGEHCRSRGPIAERFCTETRSWIEKSDFRKYHPRLSLTYYLSL